MKKEIEIVKRVFAEEKTYLQLKNEAEILILDNKDLKKMSIKGLRTILKSLKQNSDKALPTQKVTPNKHANAIQYMNGLVKISAPY